MAAAMETPPDENELQAVSFATHATRGLIRDRAMRRKTIAILLALAVFMAIAGSTFLKGALNPREHLGWFAIFWLACGWLTITILLLALFDLLSVRSEARRARRILIEQAARGLSDPPAD
jgi:hypothetical protein